MRFPEVSGPGLNWKAVECALDRESGVVRVRIGESEHLRDAECIHLHEGILQKQKNQTSASSNNPLHRQPALITTRSMDLPMRWFFAPGLGGRIRPSAARNKEWM
jgi:hypothetical protein